MSFLEGFVTNYIYAAYFDFCSTRWHLATVSYFEASPYVARLLKQPRVYPSSISLTTHVQLMQSSSLGTTCHRDEYLLFDNKPKHILLAVN